MLAGMVDIEDLGWYEGSIGLGTGSGSRVILDLIYAEPDEWFKTKSVIVQRYYYY